MSAAEKNYDFLIKNAIVYDGVSKKPLFGDVAIAGDKIAAVGNLAYGNATVVIDARGSVLAPGFIDTHTHSDFNPLVYPDLGNKIMQGVTTEVTGNCGMSAAPVLGDHSKHINGIWAREGVTVAEKIPWTSFKDYKKDLEKRGLFTNFVGLVGHGNLRSAVMGFEPRPAQEKEIEKMRSMLRQAMDEGAAGISYGLVYVPGIFAEEKELLELCTEVGQRDGICAFHMRNESSRVVEAVTEAIRIGEKAKARIEISHLKAAGKNNWGQITPVLNLIENAWRKNQVVYADVYPYTGSFAELGVLLPDAMYQRQDRVEYFRDMVQRPGLVKELQEFYKQKTQNWDAVMLASTEYEAYWPYEGKTFSRISKETGKAPEQFLVEILADTGFEVSAFYFSQSETVVSEVIRKPYVTIGSDSIADGSRKPHPRAYGTFPRVLGEYVKNKKSFSLGEAIRKMTSLPAESFAIKKRGKIREGYYADIVIFNPEAISDAGSYENPKMVPSGIRWVFVNGKAAVRDGMFLGKKNGRFLTRN